MGVVHEIKLILDAVLLIVLFIAMDRRITGSFVHELFPSVSKVFGFYDLWVAVHILCAVLILVCVFIHICMHAKLFAGLIRKAVHNPAAVKAWQVGSRLTAIILAILVIKISIDNVTEVAASVSAADRYVAQTVNVAETASTAETAAEAETQTEEYVLAEDDEDYEEVYYEGDNYEVADDEEYIEPEPEPEEQVMSLSDYLGGLFCPGCDRQCSLLSPRCGKGENNASQATAEYYEIYGA